MHFTMSTKKNKNILLQLLLFYIILSLETNVKSYKYDCTII